MGNRGPTATVNVATDTAATSLADGKSRSNRNSARRVPSARTSLADGKSRSNRNVTALFDWIPRESS